MERVGPPNDPRAHRSARRTRWTSYLLGAFGLGMSAQVLFLLTLRARELGASFEVIGLIAGLTIAAPALFAVVTGAFVDRIGPMPSFVLGALFAGATTVMLIVVTDHRWFLVLGPVVGTCMTTAWTASQSQVTGLGSRRERPAHTGRFSLFTNVGEMVGPLIAGLAFQVAGARFAFLGPAAYAFLFSVIGVWLWFRSPTPPRHGERPPGLGIRAALRLAVRPAMQVALLLTSSRLWIHLVYVTFLPVHLVESGLPGAVVGTVMATSGLVAAAVAPTAGILARRWSEHGVTAVPLCFGALGLAMAPMLVELPWVYVVPLLIGIGSGLSLPLLLSLTTAAAPESQRGIALGLRATVNQTAGAAAPATMGPLFSAFGAVVGFPASGLGGVLLLVAAGVRHRLAADRSADVAVDPRGRVDPASDAV